MEKGRGTAWELEVEVSGWRGGGESWAVVGGQWVAGRGVGFTFAGCGAPPLVCAGGGCGAVSKGGVAGGIPPHKGSRLRLTVPKKHTGKGVKD